MAKTKILYRFFDKEGAEKSIETRTFRVGRIRKLNDPFELVPGISDYEKLVEESALSWVDNFVSTFDSLFGVFCFSETAKEPVMWSHYADHHKGMAFEVDYLLEPNTLRKVRYTDKRVCFDSELINLIDEPKDRFSPKLMELIFRKSRGWRYEREWRGYIPLDECFEKDAYIYKEIPENFFMRVILGHRCESSESDVRALLDHNGFDYVKVTRAKLCPKTYKIIC